MAYPSPMRKPSITAAAPRATGGMGPKSWAVLERAGIRSLDELKAVDAFALYARLKPLTPGMSINFLYGVLAAQEGTHWLTVQRERRTEILLRLDGMWSRSS